MLKEGEACGAPQKKLCVFWGAPTRPHEKRAARHFNITGPCFSVHAMPRHEDEIFRLLCATLGRRGVAARFALASEVSSETFAEMQALAESERVLPALYDALADRHGTQVAKPMRAVGAVHREENRRRNAAIRHALVELGEAAAAEGFAFAALKGTAWVIEDGDGPAAWRSMLDMDVLVDAKRFHDIPSFLDRLGYIRLSNDARYDVNFHHAPYARPDGPATIEVHRHLGWRHRLLAPDIVFDCAQSIAAGLLLPAPWCRAFHAIIHWQIQDFGLSRATMPLKDVLEVDRFLARSDVDWAVLSAHVGAAGAMEACEAAIALAVDLFGGSRPHEIPLRAFGRRHVARALARKASPWRTWLAREKWRAGTLWRCEKVAYRCGINGAHPAVIHAAVWAGRLVRLPYLFARAVGIIARALTMLASDRKQRKYFARVR
jgi:hypothetical protein